MASIGSDNNREGSGSETSAGVTVKKKKKRIRGFAGIIWNNIKTLNEYNLTEIVGPKPLKILLVSVDDRYAALITISDGKLSVDAVKYDRKDPAALKQLIRDTDWNGLLVSDTEGFFGLMTGKTGTGKLLGMILGRKLRGIGAMLKFAKLLSLLKPASSVK